jgi:carbamate kinase
MTHTADTIVVAVGGNALQPPGERADIYDQFRHTRESLAVVVALAREGWQIVIVHGNGPQVGDALVRNEMALSAVEPLPVGVLVASTAGWIGYMIQQSLQNALTLNGIDRDVLTIITQSVVRRDDPCLKTPSKPIGNPLNAEEAKALKLRGEPVGKDGSGRLRRLCPSPDPYDVVESDAVRQLVHEGKIVVAAGGGGPPVYQDERGRLEGLDAVVDKDRTAAILGCKVGASTLLILTDVEGVYRGWNTDQKKLISRLSVSQAEELLAGDELGRGSMRPKVEAAVDFVRGGGKRGIIAELACGIEALRGETGTIITGELE